MKAFTLITGASGGIGKELALQFAKNGHDLILVARGYKKLKTLAQELHETYGVNVAVIEQDLAKPGSALQLFERIESENYEIEILVNNTGVGLGGDFAEQDLGRLQYMMQLNMNTLTDLTRLILPGMIKKGSGKILNVSSTAAFLPGPSMAVYFATKAYVYSLSRALAYELRSTGVTMTVLCPGPTKSNFAANAGMKGTRLFSGKLMSSEAVAKAAYDGTMARKELVIPGGRNKVMVAALRWLPNSLLMKVINDAQTIT